MRAGVFIFMNYKRYNRKLTFHPFSPRSFGTPRFLPLYHLNFLWTIGKKNRSKSIPCYIKRIISRWILVLCSLFTIHYSLSTVSYAETPNRIISLAPSVTEILFAAGFGDRVVGVTTFCDYPPEAKRKPKIGGMSNPSLEAVISLKPDIVVMTIDGNPKEFEQKLSSMKVKTYEFESRTLSARADGIRKMGIALDARERFDSLASGIEQSINKFRGQGSEDKKLRRWEDEKTSTSEPLNFSNSQIQNSALKKKVLFIIWPEPLIVAGPGTAIDDAINLLGGINIAKDAKGRYPKYSIEEIIRQSPDVIFFGRGKGMDEISSRLLKRLSSVPAVKNKKVFYVGDSLYRLGPRVIKGIEELEGYLNEKKDSRGQGTKELKIKY